MRRALILCAAASLLLPAMAGAVTIHQHIRDPATHKLITRVVTVAPRDSDDDGCANAQDHYNGPGCKPPPPPVAAPSQSVAPATTVTPSVPSASAGGCPSYMAGEASSPSAVNPSSGAAGCFQILPSTQAAYGCSDVGPSCAAAICADVGNAAWAASGSTPCDYLKP